MDIISTSTDEVSIQLVSPLSGVGAGAVAAAASCAQAGRAAKAAKPSPPAMAANLVGKCMINPSISKRCFIGLASADAEHLFDVQDEDLAVADGAGPGGLLDRLDDPRREAGRRDDLDLDLRHQAGRIFGAAIDLGMPLLAAVALDLGDGQALDADRGERLADLVELEGLYDRDNEFHFSSPVQNETPTEPTTPPLAALRPLGVMKAPSVST